MKTWCFEKNVPATELATVLAKAKKRKREEGKETRIFYNGTEIDEKRIARFKRRELGEVALASPSAGKSFFFSLVLVITIAADSRDKLHLLE